MSKAANTSIKELNLINMSASTYVNICNKFFLLSQHLTAY